MHTLDVDSAFTFLKLKVNSQSGQSLSEQAKPFLTQNPNLILDVEGIQFTSLTIGELVNLHQVFTNHWGERPHRILLVNMTDFSREVFRRVKLNPYLECEDPSGVALRIPKQATGD